MKLMHKMEDCKSQKEHRIIFITVLIVLTICLNVGFSKGYMLSQGDVTIAGMFDVQTVEDGHCGEINIASVMSMEAVRWYLNTMNNENAHPFKIGLKEYKTCGNTGLAGKYAVDILSRYRQARVINSSDDFFVGVLGPSFSSEAQVVSSILGSQSPSDRFLQIGFSSTSTVLNDRAKYPNFYRVIPEDSIQITTMVKLMKSLEWNRVAFIYDNDTYGRICAEYLKSASTKNDICISKIYPITIDSSRLVDITQIRSIIDEIVVKSPSIQGVVYIGGKSVANKILQIVNSLEFTDVPIFILSESTQLQLDVFQATDGKILSKTKGTLVVSAPYSEVSDFRDHWNSLFTDINVLNDHAKANPYLNDVFTAYTGCDVTKKSCAPMTEAQINEKASPQSVYVKYAVFAAHILVGALRKVFDTICSGKCSSVQEFKENFEPSHVLLAMDKLSRSYKGLSVTFTKTSANAQLGPNLKVYEVYNFRKKENEEKFGLVNVGYLSNGELFLEKERIKDYAVDGSERNYPNVRKGQCPVQQICEECIRSDLTKVDFHIPGDFYIIGIVSINNRALSSPQGCGRVRTRHGYQMYLTLKFAIEEFKTRNWYAQYLTKFAGHSIGLVVINSCNNALEVVRKILNLHSDGLRLPDGDFLNLTNRTLGYIGGQPTDVSEPAAVQLTNLGFVQISYSSTNPILSNKMKYPYFLRIITPDNVQAKAMIDIVKELNGEYIQIVYSEGAYGEGGRDAVVAAAAEANICIAQEILVLEKEWYYEHYRTLQKKPFAKLVIVFLRSHVVGPFMRDMSSEMKRGEFQFIGSEAWGKNKKMLEYDINRGSITVAVEMDKNTNLEEYLKAQIPSYNNTDPWLEEYIQNREDCYFDWSYDKKFPLKCNNSILPINDASFESDPWCIFVFNTVISFLKGASEFFKSKCGAARRTALCEDFVDSPNDFVEVLKRVTMNIYGTGDILVYDSVGDGLMGYKVYNIKDNSDRTSREYVQIGSYNLGSGLQFQTNNVGYPTDEAIKSTCPSEQACVACRPEPEPVPPENKSDPTVPALGGVVGVLAVIIIILVAVIVIKLRHRPLKEGTYLTPSHLPHGMNFPSEERQVGEGKHHSDESDPPVDEDEKF